MTSRIRAESAPQPLPAPRPAQPGGPAARPVAPLLDRLGLASSAILLSDLGRPVAWLGSQVLLVLQPTLSLLGAGPKVAGLLQTLEEWDAPEGAPPKDER